jgi:hypothetical protein
MSNFLEGALPYVGLAAGVAAGIASGGAATPFIYGAMGLAAGSEASAGMAASDAARAAAQAQEQQVKTQNLQQQYKISKQQNQEAQIVHEQLAQNEMMAVQRGVSTQSPSFNAIQVDTLRNAQQAMSEGTKARQPILRISTVRKVPSNHKYFLARLAASRALYQARQVMVWVQLVRRILRA